MCIRLLTSRFLCLFEVSEGKISSIGTSIRPSLVSFPTMLTPTSFF